MKNFRLRTLCVVYHVLIVLLGIILSCESKSFDWGTLEKKYGTRDDDITAQDVAMPGVIPTKDDEYLCTSVQMPKQNAYIVDFTPHATMKKAHHMLLYGCKGINSNTGEAHSCAGMGVCGGGQSSIMFAWARDAPAPSIPEGVGFHVGGNSDINYATLQVHYGHKDAFKDGEEDFSGIELSITYQPQQFLAGIYLLVSGNINVPAHARNYHSDVACEYRSDVPIYPFAFRTHAHELGKVISGYVLEDTYRGDMTPIAKGDPQWPQAFYPMKRVEIARGDWLIARCTFDSDKDNAVGVGPGGSDEMCNLYLMYYTDAEYGQSFQICSNEARGDMKSRIPEKYSNTPPANMPEIIEQPPAGEPRQESYYPGYDYRQNPLQEYRNKWQEMLYPDPDYQSENTQDLNQNGWPDDEEGEGHDTEHDDKTETEKPQKEEETTPVISSDKGSEDGEESKEDIGTGKLTVAADWHTDDSVTLGQVAGIAVDAKGNVHVFHRAERSWGIESFDANNRYATADDGPIANHTVIAFNPDTGNIVPNHQWGGKVNSAEDCETCFHGFYLPHGLSIDHEGNLWLTDVALHQVFKFPPGGAETPLLMLGKKLEPGSNKDHFCKPADVAVDPTTGNFFVADGYCNSRIMKFSPQGEFLMEWGKVTYKSSGYPSDAFLIPHSLTYLKDKDILCVADREHGRIQCFNSGDGSYVDSYKQDIFGTRVFAVHYNPWNGGVLYAVNGPSGERVPVQGFTLSYGDKQVLGTWKPDKEFQNPHDVECSADNTAVYVAEIGPNKVWKFNVDIATPSIAAPKPITCIDVCANGGQCYYNTLYQKYMCACNGGFDGPTCMRAINICDPNPCLNQGMCFKSTDSSSSFCSCQTGYRGSTCQILDQMSDPCSSQPCRNAGLCSHTSSGSTGYTCACHDGFTGANCETNSVLDTCSSQPCQNSAICSHTRSSSTGYTCACLDGFIGANCETNSVSNPVSDHVSDSCSSQPCQNAGVCSQSSSSSTGYVCACHDGFIGTNCEENSISDPCSSQPCRNSGVCSHSRSEGYVCACHDGFSGANCETKSACPEGCANNGTCFFSRSKRQFMCSCLDGFAGPTCRDVVTFVDPCEPDPCLNQGACFQAPASSISRFICACKHGYNGDMCQYGQIVPPSEDTKKKEETIGNPLPAKSGKPGQPVVKSKSFQAQEAGLKAQTDDEILGHKVNANDANTATTAIIVAVLAVPIVLMMMVAVAVRLRAQGKIKFGGNGLKVGYSSTADRFSLGNFFNKRRGFNQVSTEDSDHDGGMEWSEESDIEEYSILNNTKTSQNL